MIKLLIYIILIFACKNNQRNLEDSLILDKDNWEYNSNYAIFYQFNITYCKNPDSNNQNILGIYVPRKYFLCTKLSTEKYSCSINPSGKFGIYNASTAPIILPIYGEKYLAEDKESLFYSETFTDFSSSGFIYIYIGFRNEYQWNSDFTGAPWGITDLKAAIRFIRYNSDLIPGDMNSIFSFGFGTGGAQSCLLGIAGNNELYNDYLNKIGSAMYYNNGTQISDAIKGSQCWCPITNLDTADMSYEWNIGQYFTSGSREYGTIGKQLSDDLTLKYREYINQLRLKDENGTILSLSTNSVNSGSYYDYLKSVIQNSLNNFLSDTTFPYTSTPKDIFDGWGWGYEESDDINTYETVFDYINFLNSNDNWVYYDSSTNTATITDIGSFVKKCKNPTRDVGAFDDFNKNQNENQLFGVSSQTSAHFDNYILNILNEKYYTYYNYDQYISSVINNYNEDIYYLSDSLGHSISHRVNMYNPMYYICDYYSGYKTSQVASYFRINTGINQGETSNCVEMNLALALKNYGKNVNVEFTTVWDQGYTSAERIGSKNGTSNFISWVNKCMSNINSQNSNMEHSYNDNGDTISNNYYFNSKINKKYFMFFLFLLF